MFNVEKLFSMNIANAHWDCAVMHTHDKKMVTMIAWRMMFMFVPVPY